MTVTFAPATTPPDASFTVPAITPVSFCAHELPQERAIAKTRATKRKLVEILPPECSSRLLARARPDRMKRTSLFTCNAPPQSWARVSRLELAADDPTPQDYEKQTLIAHVISPIVHICHLFLSNMMYFVFLRSFFSDLWHNRLLLDQHRDGEVDEPAGRGTEISHPRGARSRTNDHRLRTDSHTRRHRSHHPPRPGSLGEGRRARPLAWRRRFAYFQHEFSALLRSAGPQQSCRKAGDRAGSGAIDIRWRDCFSGRKHHG